jgi:ribosomal-protein-alanine N-acetyltransferase
VSPAIIELHWLTPTTSAAIVAGERAPGWADDLPDPGLVEVARWHLEATSHGLAPDYPFGHFLIRDIARDLVVGGIGCHGHPINGTVEIGYGIVPSQRRRGYATRAISVLIALLQRSPAVELVRARVLTSNEGSLRALLANGFHPYPADITGHIDLELDLGTLEPTP